jgi:arginyl-tRNA synthetase
MRGPSLNLKNEISLTLSRAISSAVKDGIFPDELSAIERKVEYPRDPKFGDYSTPFALESAKILRKSPMQIGADLAGFLKDDPRIARVDVVKPGFINMFISNGCLFDNLKEVITRGPDYGRGAPEEGKRINIEFVSANPTGPLNIVSARAAAVGDTIANLLEFTGDAVDREFYVNDYGNQVTMLGLSVRARMGELTGEAAVIPEDGYHGEYVKDIAAHIADKYADEIKSIKDETALIDFIAAKAVEYNIKKQRVDLEKFNVRFKTWFSEKTLHESGAVNKALQLLEGSGETYTAEGKVFFKSTGYNDDKDRVLVREDGRPTYFLADVAYHNEKIMRGYDLIIDIWGPDHHGHVKRMAAAMKALGLKEEHLSILIAQQVNLVMEGETVKMSKRMGQFSTMRDLIDEIGSDVARYFFIMRSLESHLDFDLALAKKESSENPVFYLQYAHARICSLFNEAEKRNIGYDAGNARSELLNDEESVTLMKQVAKFPEEILDAARNFEPHRIATYLMRLAQAFHKFYTEHRIVTEDRERTVTYLALTQAVRIVMANGLTLLGVSAPEKM